MTIVFIKIEKYVKIEIVKNTFEKKCKKFKKQYFMKNWNEFCAMKKKCEMHDLFRNVMLHNILKKK